jgi:N-ethylmaleimide reductase
MDKMVLEPIEIGSLVLKNRVIMAPMTRGRAVGGTNVPTALMKTYYEQRSSAGLVITEGTWVSGAGIGIANVPGIWTRDQMEGWKQITEAVHVKGGRIFLQLGHLGAFAHPDFLDGAAPLAPSAINIEQKVLSPTGLKPSVTPKEMSVFDIERTIDDYRMAAYSARDAGFDGVEVHAQGKSLLSLFLYESLNKRSDCYGGSLENQARFLFEVVRAVTAMWPPRRVGVRLSPTHQYPTKVSPYEDTAEIYEYVIRELNDYDLAYLHIVNGPPRDMSPEKYFVIRSLEHIASLYHGFIIANGGLTGHSANYLLERGWADMASFGKMFISNPDLVHRLRYDLELNEWDPTTLRTAGEKGYTDYPFLAG